MPISAENLPGPGRLIREFREEAGLSLTAVAGRTSIPLSTLQGWETSPTVLPARTLATVLEAIAKGRPDLDPRAVLYQIIGPAGLGYLTARECAVLGGIVPEQAAA